jgi:hypothetical protein
VRPANVLIVDDDPDTAADQLAADLDLLGVEADSLKPDEVTQERLERADLILVDYVLAKWGVTRRKAVDPGVVCTSPRDGLALAAVLHSRLPEEAKRARGIGLYSARLKKLIANFSPSVTEHAAARVNGVDWAFAKADIKDLPPTPERVQSFAEALVRLADQWNPESESAGRETLEAILAVPGASWANEARRDVDAAQPPIHQFAGASDGRAILRWLAQRVLPYPTFLVDLDHVALTFGVEPSSLAEAPPEDLNRALGAGYEGSLDQFLGRRWWRAGIRAKMTDWTGSLQATPEAAERLAEKIGINLQPLEPPNSVLAMDARLRSPTVLVARENAVRILPDDWPPFAETAWLRVDAIRAKPSLRQYVDPADIPIIKHL